MATYEWNRSEAVALIEFAKSELEPHGTDAKSKHGRFSGIGTLSFKIETADGRTVIGQLLEPIEGPSCPDGLTIATTEAVNVEHVAVRWEEILWLGFGFTS
jgi:hypothetical protein